MNEIQKEALIANSSFLSKNIIWTPELAGKLLQDGLVTEYMLKDIEKHEKREAKIHGLLDVLPMRGGKAFDKFCDVLQITGHYFLSDFLRDEVNRGEISDTKGIYKRLPFLDKSLREFEKKKLEEYIIDKLKEEIVKQSWKADFTEKDKTMEAKEQQFRKTIEFEEESKVKNITISDQLDKLKETTEEICLLKTQLKTLKNSMTEQEARHKEQLNRQIKFNMANDSSLKRVQDRVQEQENTLASVRQKINGVHGIGDRTKTKADLAVDENVEFTYLLDDLEKVLEKVRHTNDIQRKYDALLEEREWIMMHLGVQNAGSPSLLHAYKQFAISNDENIHTLRREVARYSEMMKEHETKTADDQAHEKKIGVTSAWQGAVMSVLKKQVHDLKTGLKQKDKKIEVLQNEMNSLKTRIKEMESRSFEDSAKLGGRILDGSMDSQEAAQHLIDEQRTERRRSYKNSFLPPLPNILPVEHPSVSVSWSARGPPDVAVGATTSRSLGFADGLTTTSLKLGGKVRTGQPYHSMSHGLGNLKSRHPRNKYAFEMDDKAVIGKKINQDVIRSANH